MSARIWLFFYKILTWTALLLILLCLPLIRLISPKFAKWFMMRFRPKPLTYQPRLWFHAVSLGETKVALALSDHFFPGQNVPVLMTTATQAGFQNLSQRLGKDHVRYLPWDTAFCFRRLFQGHAVPHLVVVETEIWPVLFDFVAGEGVKLAIVNGRMGTKTLRRYKNPLFRRALSRVSAVSARSELDSARFGAFGVPDERRMVTGNIKFDFTAKPLARDSFHRWLSQSQPLMVFASISADEVPLLAPEVGKLFEALPELSLLWAPRHLRDLEPHLEGLAGFAPVRRTQLEGAARLVVLDSFGELASCYGFASLSLVGGSFNRRGGQNFLESLQAGTPALLGPNTENFKNEVTEALAKRAVICLKEPTQVAATVLRLLKDPESLARHSKSAKEFLAEHSGAIERSARVLIDLGILDSRDTEDS